MNGARHGSSGPSAEERTATNIAARAFPPAHEGELKNFGAERGTPSNGNGGQHDTVPQDSPLYLAASVGALSLASGASQAQEWPSRPLTMVVPTAAGGVMDLVARIFAGRLSEILGQPVIVENVGNGVAVTSRVAN